MGFSTMTSAQLEPATAQMRRQTSLLRPQRAPLSHIHSSRSPTDLHELGTAAHIHSRTIPIHLRRHPISTAAIFPNSLSRHTFCFHQLFKLSSVFSQPYKAVARGHPHGSSVS